MLTIQQIKEAVAKVGERYGIKRAYLFGSYAKGEPDEYSDVDLMIDSGEIKGLIELSGFRLDLIDELGGAEVDVIPESSVSPRFYDLIKDEWILVYGE